MSGFFVALQNCPHLEYCHQKNLFITYKGLLIDLETDQNNEKKITVGIFLRIFFNQSFTRTTRQNVVFKGT